MDAASPGSLVRQARERAGLTQAALARLAGTRQSAVSAIETGARDPTMGTLRRLLAAAGWDLDMRLVEFVGHHLRRSDLGERVVRSREAIKAAVEAHGGRDVRVFGSVARGDAGAGSDLDLLVDLPEWTGILTIGRIARDVERIVGVETDVVPLLALRPEVRAEVLTEAVPL